MELSVFFYALRGQVKTFLLTERIFPKKKKKHIVRLVQKNFQSFIAMTTRSS